MGSAFVSEVDESDGSIALYRAAVGVLLNVSLDHKSMDELRALFGDFLSRCTVAAINADNAEALALLPRAKQALTFGIDQPKAQIGIVPGSIADGPVRQAATVIDRHDGAEYPLILNMPGRHNLSNALAAIAGAVAAGVPIARAVAALAGFAGLARRFDIIGVTQSGITVIDDFGHNPEKCAATLRTLKAHPGRVIAFFQPHGYGPLRQMGAELAETFAEELDADDLTILCDPVYFGGTVDRSEGSERIVRLIAKAGGNARIYRRSRGMRGCDRRDGARGRSHRSHGRARRYADGFRAIRPVAPAMNIYARAVQQMKLMLGSTALGLLMVIIWDRYLPHSTIPFVIAIAMLLYLGRDMRLLNCPRCGKNLFMRRWLSVPWPNRVCTRCGLDLGSASKS